MLALTPGSSNGPSTQRSRAGTRIRVLLVVVCSRPSRFSRGQNLTKEPPCFKTGTVQIFGGRMLSGPCRSGTRRLALTRRDHITQLSNLRLLGDRRHTFDFDSVGPDRARGCLAGGGRGDGGGLVWSGSHHITVDHREDLEGEGFGGQASFFPLPNRGGMIIGRFRISWLQLHRALGPVLQGWRREMRRGSESN